MYLSMLIDSIYTYDLRTHHIYVHVLVPLVNLPSTLQDVLL
jgi:hypothetical protein